MPSLLESASLTPEVSLMDREFPPLNRFPRWALLIALRLDFAADDDPENEIDYTQDWEQVNIGGQNIGIKTSSLQQTAEAFAMLVVYASSELRLRSSSSTSSLADSRSIVLCFTSSRRQLLSLHGGYDDPRSQESHLLLPRRGSTKCCDVNFPSSTAFLFECTSLTSRLSLSRPISV